MLAVDLSNKVYFKHAGVDYFGQLGKVKSENEWHLYFNNRRIIISEIEYNQCLQDNKALENLILINMNRG